MAATAALQGEKREGRTKEKPKNKEEREREAKSDGIGGGQTRTGNAEDVGAPCIVTFFFLLLRPLSFYCVECSVSHFVFSSLYMLWSVCVCVGFCECSRDGGPASSDGETGKWGETRHAEADSGQKCRGGCTQHIREETGAPEGACGHPSRCGSPAYLLPSRLLHHGPEWSRQKELQDAETHPQQKEKEKRGRERRMGNQGSKTKKKRFRSHARRQGRVAGQGGGGCARAALKK